MTQPSAESDLIFQRADDLSYERRRDFLEEGEDAIVVDPIESPLWYISGGEGELERLAANPEARQRAVRIARLVQRWSSRGRNTPGQ